MDRGYDRDGPTNDSLEGREDEDMIYLRDDERERDGVHNIYLDEGEQGAAMRSDILRQLESLEKDTLDWLEFSDDEDAQSVYEGLTDLRELPGETPEESDDERV